MGQSKVRDRDKAFALGGGRNTYLIWPSWQVAEKANTYKSRQMPLRACRISFLNLIAVCYLPGRPVSKSRH
jgi:hypothetical protein